MEDLLPILLLAFWALVGWLGQRAKKKGQQSAQSEQKGPSAFEQFLQQISKEAGLAPEQPPPPPPPVPTRVVVPRPAGTGSEHRPSASEHRLTASEHLPSASEHRLTASEHLPGDMPLPAVPRLGAKAKHRRTKLGAELAADLHGGQRALSRAIILREILGPPVSLRSPDERS